VSAPGRAALLIATSSYDDPSLPALDGAVNDAEALAAVLRDADIGRFDVRTVTDRPAHEVAAEVEDFLHARQRRELVMLYITGHGVKGADGQLYFAARNTDSDRLRSTAVAASWISGALDACRSGRQLLLLDCCHSGAFVRGMQVKAGAQVGATEQLAARGRVIMTASDAVQFALERGERNEPASSVFTDCVVRGLRTGDADVDGDGRVTLNDLFDYVQDAVRAENPAQSPQMTAVGLQGEIVVANNPRADSRSVLPRPLVDAAEHPYSRIRRAAVDDLATLLDAGDRAVRAAAERALRTMVDDDSRTVATAARRVLGPVTPPRPEHEDDDRSGTDTHTDTEAPSSDDRTDADASGAAATSGTAPTASRGRRERPARARVIAAAITACLVLLAGVVVVALAPWSTSEGSGEQPNPVGDTGEEAPEDPAGPDAPVAADVPAGPEGLRWQRLPDLGSGQVLSFARTQGRAFAAGNLTEVTDDDATLEPAVWQMTADGWVLRWDPDVHDLHTFASCDSRIRGIAGNGAVLVGVGHEGPQDCQYKRPVAWWDVGSGPQRAVVDYEFGVRMEDVAWDGGSERFWAVGGGPDGARVWHSDDGQTWTPVDDDSFVADGTGMTAVRATSRGVFAVGQVEQRPTLWWRREDAWERIRLPGGRGRVEAIAEGAGAVVAVGRVDVTDGDADIAVWRLEDGASEWTRVSDGAFAADGGQELRAVEYQRGFLAVANGAGSPTERLWTSPDGRRWTPSDALEVGRATSLNAVVRHDDGLLLGAGLTGGDPGGPCVNNGCDAVLYHGRP
jgi:hypothetical protein